MVDERWRHCSGDVAGRLVMVRLSGFNGPFHRLFHDQFMTQFFEQFDTRVALDGRVVKTIVAS